VLTIFAPLSWHLSAGESRAGVNTAKKISLKTTLEKQLRARRKSEFAFIAKVVSLVEKKKIPLSMVNSTFLWARRKRPYPMMYFEFAMKIRAKKIGVVLTPR